MLPGALRLHIPQKPRALLAKTRNPLPLKTGRGSCTPGPIPRPDDATEGARAPPSPKWVTHLGQCVRRLIPAVCLAKRRGRRRSVADARAPLTPAPGAGSADCGRPGEEPRGACALTARLPFKTPEAATWAAPAEAAYAARQRAPWSPSLSAPSATRMNCDSATVSVGVACSNRPCRRTAARSNLSDEARRGDRGNRARPAATVCDLLQDCDCEFELAAAPE